MQASYGEARRSARSAKAAGPAQTNPDAYVFFDICAAANAPVTPRCGERIALGGNVAGRCLQATRPPSPSPPQPAPVRPSSGVTNSGSIAGHHVLGFARMAEEVTMTLLIASLTLMGALVASQPQQAVAPMGRVSGRVIEDGTNTPVAGARVFVGLDAELATPVDPSPETVTDRDGRYHLDALPAGRYYIAAEKAGFAPPMEPSTMQRLEVSAGQALGGRTVVMRRGGVFTGRVLDSIGQPLANAGVTALLKRLTSIDWPAGPTWSGAPLLMPSGQSQTNDLGEFRIFGLSAGE